LIATTAVSNEYTTIYAYAAAQPYAAYDPDQTNEEEEKVYYDPVRDTTR
jgi:hypothetical protein